MTHILVLNSSISREASVSRILVEEAVQRLIEVNPGATVRQRDLGNSPIPHLTPATVAGVRAAASTPEEHVAAALSDELIEELRAADIIVIGAPMYNFSIASGLRTWFDHVIRPRVTFSYSEAGPQGLLTGKRILVIESRGGLYSEGPSKAIDFQEPYLRWMLSFIGLSDVTFVHAEKIGFGVEARQAALAHAKAQIGVAAAKTISHSS